jgi:hypothetical protein
MLAPPQQFGMWTATVDLQLTNFETLLPCETPTAASTTGIAGCVIEYTIVV